MAYYFEKSEKHLLFSITKQLSFSRLKTIDTQVLSKGHATATQLSPLSLAEFISAEGDYPPQQITSFLYEIANSSANLAFALAWQAYQHDSSTSILPIPSPTKLYATWWYEQQAFNGHSIHPGAKSKIGMSPEEVFRYSPEFGERVSLRFAAVQRKYVQASFPTQSTAEINKVFFQLVEGLEAELHRRLGLNCSSDYVVVPVHPWQWKHTLPTLFSADLASGHILLLESVLPAWPTLSVRTVLPDVAHLVPPHIKLPINVQTTSAIRALSNEAVQNGPLLTQALLAIMKLEPTSSSVIQLLAELGGINYLSPIEGDRSLKAKHLAFLLRENPDQYRKEDEVIIVGAALVESVHQARTPLIVQLIEEGYPSKEPQSGVCSFFNAYCEIVLSTLKLLSKYGVGLEAHLQNSLLVFKHGVPQRIMVRDLGGARVDRNRLERQGISLACSTDSSILSTAHEARNKLIHALMQNHLGEIVHCLSDYYCLPESYFWLIVQSKCRLLYAQWKLDPSFADHAAEDEQQLFAPYVETKALTRMRLEGNVKNYLYMRIANPLYDNGAQRQ
nr:IucA/IucC family protein [Paenibacillus sp. SYP-B3998]